MEVESTMTSERTDEGQVRNLAESIVLRFPFQMVVPLFHLLAGGFVELQELANTDAVVISTGTINSEQWLETGTSHAWTDRTWHNGGWCRARRKMGT